MPKIDQVNSETGEVVGSFVAVIQPKQKSSFTRHFTMNQDAIFNIAKNLKPEQLRVLLILMAHLDYENYIQIAQTQIMKSLDIEKANVSRAIKSLIEESIILEGPKIGRSKSYRLNPSYGWKGTVTNHKKALKAGLAVIKGGKE